MWRAALLPLCVRMWISSELALGQLLLHRGNGHTRSLGYASLGLSCGGGGEEAAAAPAAFCRLAQ